MFEKIVCLGGHAVSVRSDKQDAREIISFMFDDIQADEFDNIEASFSLTTADAPFGDTQNKPWIVQKDDQQIYANHSLVDAANFLMGEVLFMLITNNRQTMAIHAGLLSDEHGGILLPGESGNGKSSLCLWMTLNGYHYHTDELVLITPGSLETRVFTRPFNIKAHGIAAIETLLDLDKLTPPAASGDFITMIAHRALNPDFIQASPELSRIVFPKFSKTANNALRPVSRAAAGIELMKTHVIARNLPGHGFEQLLEIVKSIPAFELNYNHFDALPTLLGELNTLS